MLEAISEPTVISPNFARSPYPDLSTEPSNIIPTPGKSAGPLKLSPTPKVTCSLTIPPAANTCLVKSCITLSTWLSWLWKGEPIRSINSPMNCVIGKAVAVYLMVAAPAPINISVIVSSSFT